MARLARALAAQQQILASASEAPGAFRMRYTLAQLDAIYDASDGQCAICKRIPNRKLNLDHCHRSGKLRGLLCTRCNTALGRMGDDAELLQRAADYLRAHAPS